MSGIFVVLLAGSPAGAAVVVVDGAFGGAPLASEAFG